MLGSNAGSPNGRSRRSLDGESDVPGSDHAEPTRGMRYRDHFLPVGSELVTDPDPVPKIVVSAPAVILTAVALVHCGTVLSAQASIGAAAAWGVFESAESLRNRAAPATPVHTAEGSDTIPRYSIG